MSYPITAGIVLIIVLWMFVYELAYPSDTLYRLQKKYDPVTVGILMGFVFMALITLGFYADSKISISNLI